FLKKDQDFMNLDITENFFSRLQEEEINDYSFIKLKKDDLRECELRIGLAIKVKDYIGGLDC
ncbi:3358_t:CDS:1, partial [Dentiscutata erythropus]